MASKERDASVSAGFFFARALDGERKRKEEGREGDKRRDKLATSFSVPASPSVFPSRKLGSRLSTPFLVFVI